MKATKLKHQGSCVTSEASDLGAGNFTESFEKNESSQALKPHSERVTPRTVMEVRDAKFCLDSDIDEIVELLGDVGTKFEGKKILIAGGCGFLGRYFYRVFERLNLQVFKKPCRVTILDNFITSGAFGRMEEIENFTFIKHNIIDPIEVDEAPDFIIHLAGIASPYYYRKFPLETLDVAINGTRNLLELAAKHHASLTYFSSSEIYGDPDPRHCPTPESYRGYVAC